MQINKECIEKIYKSHELITDVYIDDTKESKFQICLFHNDDPITETKIILEFKDNESLLPYAKEKGNVVKIKIFMLVEKYRRKGICKSIHKQEVRFYKEHNIQQMQLIATYSGFFAWSKLGFLCGAKEENKAKGIVIAYLAQSTESMEFLSQVNLSSLLKKIEDKADDFLVWAEKTSAQIKIPMYKDI
ncbi:hypothetical protein NCR96_09155 [Helicobacter sp. 14348-15]|uniref:hypothetical protein n=1 Tax=Helicobacter colisuis TaxID=2949739 RepID=UPI00202AECCE|nr:hypothetical protein [Helicobacter colisuis]MCL9821901.1 hypothetical protein [Helicobacter colisuis]